jgi:sugar phosphate isomerase/epimerase
MYKNLNAAALGVSGRQSELIELALTYGFAGFDLDLPSFCKQVELRGLDHARRYLDSAHLKIGVYELPVRWDGDEGVFQEDLEKLPALAETAAAVGAKACYTTVMPACDDRPYHENFEFHRQRLGAIAEKLAPMETRLGLAFLAPSCFREGKQYGFIATPDALVTLMKTIVGDNLGLLIDLWHWRLAAGSLDAIRELGPQQVVMVRVADLPKDVEMDAVTDEHRLLPGTTGLVDTAASISLLAEIGYRGPVTPFPSPTQTTGETRDRIVQRAASALDTAIQAAGLEVPGRTFSATAGL